jgi:hypothetical protein
MEQRTLSSTDVASLVERELGAVSHPPLQAALRQALITPALQNRKWDYSQVEEELPCWIVAEFRGVRLALAYSPLGHGCHGDCWGVVQLGDEWFGRDDSWFPLLEDAFISSGQYHGPLPDGYEVR